MGPYVVNADGRTLRKNFDAWNTFANVVYIESPAGVGYSYSTNRNTTTNDDQTSKENYQAIRAFFSKYPQFRSNKMYVMGESYGGIYVPTLAMRILRGMSQFPLNFRGIVLGNGFVNVKLDLNSLVRFTYGHGLLDQKSWDTLEKQCCNGCADSCNFADFTIQPCRQLIKNLSQFVWLGGLNPYDLYQNCDPNPAINSKKMFAMAKGLLERKLFDELKMAEYQASNSNVPCLNNSNLIAYMNRADVKSAINIPDGLQKWDICSDQITSSYKQQYDDMSGFIKKIIQNGLKVLLYYGDTDMACNFMMGQIFSNQLNLRRKSGKTPWKFNGQIAGFKTVYEGLTFLTVRGAGHMAAQWKSGPVSNAIRQFTLDKHEHL